MMISTKGRYALRVMVDLAEHQGEGYIPFKGNCTAAGNFGEISGSNFKSAGAGALSDRRARKRRRL